MSIIMQKLYLTHKTKKAFVSTPVAAVQLCDGAIVFH